MSFEKKMLMVFFYNAHEIFIGASEEEIIIVIYNKIVCIYINIAASR